MDMSKAALAAVLAAVLSAAPVAAQEDPIVFGGALCLTGVQAPLDTPGFRGAQVAVKALNDAGGLLGRPVEFINIDGKSDPVTVGNAAVELIDQGADLILAPCDFDFGGPASREAQTAGLVGLSLCASDPLYSSWSLGDKQFTLSMWNTTMGATAAEYAFKERGWKTAYVVTDQFIAYTKSLSKYFIEHFEALGGEILLEDTYTNGDNNFSAQLARLQALDKKPDVIFVSSYGQDIGAIIRALREVGYDAPVMGGDAYDDPAMIASLGPTLGNDIYFVTHTWMGAEASPDMQKFIDLYTAMFNEPPDTAFAATGWDAVMMLAQAVTAAGSTDGAAVAKALEDGQFKLLTGDLDYRNAEEGHAPDKSAVLVEVKGGKPSLPRLAHPGKHAAGLILPVAQGVALVASEVSVEFAGLRALDRVSLALPQGEILGLIGPNGSGKTTLVNAITGQVPLRHGRITAGEVDLTGRSPREVALAGVARTFQVGRHFDRLTVLESVATAALSHGAGVAAAKARAWGLLEEFGLGARHDDLAGGLSFGDKRRVEVARALAGEPQFLLLDEPAAGMNDVETEALLELLAALAGEPRARAADHRPRHEPDHAALRPAARAGLGPHHRRGRPAGGARRPGGDRGLPRPRGGGCLRSRASRCATARCGRCAARRSRWGGASWWRCSAPTGRASPRR